MGLCKNSSLLCVWQVPAVFQVESEAFICAIRWHGGLKATRTFHTGTFPSHKKASPFRSSDRALCNNSWLASGVHHLILGSIANQALGVCEGHIAGGGPVALVVWDDLNPIILPRSNAAASAERASASSQGPMGDAKRLERSGRLLCQQRQRAVSRAIRQLLTYQSFKEMISLRLGCQQHTGGP